MWPRAASSSFDARSRHDEDSHEDGGIDAPRANAKSRSKLSGVSIHALKFSSRSEVVSHARLLLA